MLCCEDAIASRPPRRTRGRLRRQSALIAGWETASPALRSGQALSLAATDFEGVCNRTLAIYYPACRL